MNDSAKPSAARQGGCLCGAVRYEISSDPEMTGVCYCSSCRRLSGSGHAFHALLPESALVFTGQVSTYEWTADSGGRVSSSFCPVCGSPLFGKSTAMPGVVTLRVASLDDPAPIKPQTAVYAKRLLPWDRLDPALPAFPEMPPAPAGG